MSLVHQRKDAYYDATDRAEKNRLAREVQECVQERLDPPGRFVQVVDWDEVDWEEGVEDLEVGEDTGEGAGSIDMDGEDSDKNNKKKIKTGADGNIGGDSGDNDGADNDKDRNDDDNDNDNEEEEEEEDEILYEIVEDELVMEKIKQALRQKVGGALHCIALH